MSFEHIPRKHLLGEKNKTTVNLKQAGLTEGGVFISHVPQAL